jgi:hypothetical protein
MIEAVRWPVLHDDSILGSEAPPRAPSAWRGVPGGLALVQDVGEVPAMLTEAATWAERISACVSAPQSARGSSPWWRELLARSTKCDGFYVRRGEQAEAWLLQRLHATGRLRLVEAGGKQVASNLIAFARGSELCVLFSHIPLERALAGAAFGALLSFRGSVNSELGRACRAQLESGAALARIPTGREIDGLTIATRRGPPAVAFAVPRAARVLIEPAELAAALAHWPLSSDGHENGAGNVSVRPFAGGYRVSFERRGEACAPLTLNLHAGPAWAAGNALLLEADGRTILVWRGGLLGHSRARSELMWSESCSPTFLLESAGLGLAQRVAVVAEKNAPLGPQLAEFERELGRLGELFGVEPPPALAHVLADFAALSQKQQTLLVWRSLIGLGALELDQAARLAAEALRDQGYLRGDALAPCSAQRIALAELVARAADAGRVFDRPSPGYVRAIQPDRSQYTQDDWLACLLGALPEGSSVPRRAALRRAFERACELWGLRGERLAPGGVVQRALDSCVSSALCRGLLLRAGAAGLERPGRAGIAVACPAAPTGSVQGFLDGWTQALESLAPLQRFLVTRRAGWYGKREALESVAQRLGLTLERARQIEIEAWQAIEAASSWARTLRARLERALGGARAVAVRQVVRDDAWWCGVDQHLDLCEAAFESLWGAELWRVELGAAGAREAFFARFPPWELERSFAALLERAAQIPIPAAEADYRAACEACAAELEPGLAEYLRDALEPHLELDPAEPTRVVRFTASVRPLDALPSPAHGVDSEALLRLEDVLRSVFRSAGTPLSLQAVAERVRKRLDVSDAMIAERLAAPPFLRRNADQYGLIARDVPGGAETIATVLEELASSLASRQRALGGDDLDAIAEVHVKRAWSQELLGSLVAADPALYLSAARDTTLRRWQHARLVPHTAPICPGVPSGMRPHFEKLAQQPLPAPDALRRRLSAELARLESMADSDELGALPLGRQLCDVGERLAEHAASALPESQQLAHAAIQCVLDALAPDEDEFDAAPLDTEKLTSARAVVAAVLRWLELDWLEEAPLARRQRSNPSLASGDAQSGAATRCSAPPPSLEIQT